LLTVTVLESARQEIAAPAQTGLRTAEVEA
jgi:hypothetical protein